MKTKLRKDIIFLSLLMLATLASSAFKLQDENINSAKTLVNLPPWPSHYQGKKLQRTPLSKREKYFLGNFPGKMARFTDGTRQIIMRRIIKPSRLLHPAVDCFRGLGYQISNIRISRDKNLRLWRTFYATNKKMRLKVSEQIIDKNNKVFTDTSSWYWNAMLNKTQGPWLAITVAKRQN